MQRLCVFCGSARGHDPAFAAAAEATGAELVRRGIGLVYGGGSIGLMGAIADAVLAGGGAAIGVIPRGLARAEIAHAGLSELRVVASMHARKETMASLADGFLALPGGFGTFEELLEMLTWTQLGIHAKPVGVLDVAGYWRGLRRLVDDARAAGFVRETHAGTLLFDDDVARLLDRMAAWRPPGGRRAWLDPTES
jgi:uncharacterized protein (TIGR00730 family)